MPDNPSQGRPDTRPTVKLDFTSGLEKLPPRPRMDESTTLASVSAGRELGFTGRTDVTPLPPPPPPAPFLDGRRLRSRGANTQLNLKVTAQEKEAILRDASRFIQDPRSPISNIGEFVVYAVDSLRNNGVRGE